MCDSELVILFRLDNNVYCQERTFAFGSNEAKEAHTIIYKERAEGKNIIDINELSKEEIDELLEKIENRIEKAKSNLSSILNLNNASSFSLTENERYTIENLNKELLNYWEEKYKQIMEIANTRGTYKF